MDSDDAIQARLNAKVFNLFALNKASQLLASTLDRKLLSEMAVDIVVEMGHTQNAALYLAKDPGEPFRLAATKVIEGEPFPSEFGSDARLVQTAEEQQGRPFLRTFPEPGGEAPVVPLRFQGVLVGIFVLQRHIKVEPWDQDDLEILETLASHVSLCMQNARLYQRVIEQYEALKTAQARLVQTEKLATMGQLLAGVAHELNNPLSVVLAHAAILGAVTAGGPLAARAEKIEQAAERCARIVKNFLSLARQRPPERQHVWLDQVIQEAVELLAYPLRVDNVDVRLDLADHLPTLWADPHQLHQVVVNLISNAQQAMRETPPPRRLTLTTRFEPVRGRVSVAVADTGPGISPELQARIFEPFFTTKPPGEGTGLGLSLCQGIIEEHGGTIHIESQPGQGSVFVVDLPVVAPPQAVVLARAPEARSPLRGKLILVVDDEPEILESLADILALDGQLVETAANGALALEKLGERVYDVILSDLRMPELDGPNLYRELERRYPVLLRRVIFLTGDTLSPERRTFLEQTAAPIVSKPFAVEEIRRAVQRILETGREGQE